MLGELKPKGPKEEIPVSAYRGSSTNLKELNVLADKLEGVKVVEQLLGQKCFLCSPFYGTACRWAMLGEIETQEIKTLRTLEK